MRRTKDAGYRADLYQICGPGIQIPVQPLPRSSHSRRADAGDIFQGYEIYRQLSGRMQALCLALSDRQESLDKREKSLNKREKFLNTKTKSMHKITKSKN